MRAANAFRGLLLATAAGAAWPIMLAAETGWFDTDWACRRAVTVTHSEGATLTDYQVAVELTDAFDFTHSKADGGDLRLTAADGVSAVAFWVEAWHPSDRRATIWCKLPTLPPGDTTLWLYHGNPQAASASDGGRTFDFFDDFRVRKFAPREPAVRVGPEVPIGESPRSRIRGVVCEDTAEGILRFIITGPPHGRLALESTADIACGPWTRICALQLDAMGDGTTTVPMDIRQRMRFYRLSDG